MSSQADKSYMFLANVKYGDKTPVPKTRFRCKGTAKNVERNLTHLCKKVVDHPSPCLCICGQTFNEKVESLS